MGRHKAKLTDSDWQVIKQAVAIVHRRGGGTEWRRDFGERAACSDVNPVIFFPERGQRSGRAKKICDGCPVWFDCLMYSINHRGSLNWGTYGRLSPDARMQLAKELDVSPPDIDPVKEYWGTNGWGLVGLAEYKPKAG